MQAGREVCRLKMQMKCKMLKSHLELETDERLAKIAGQLAGLHKEFGDYSERVARSEPKRIANHIADDRISGASELEHTTQSAEIRSRQKLRHRIEAELATRMKHFVRSAAEE